MSEPVVVSDPRTIYLADYEPWTHLLDRVELTFLLNPLATRVQARLHLSRNPARLDGQDLRLDGEGLRLICLAVDGCALDVVPDDLGLTISAASLPSGPFVLETEVEISPQTNTALEGLYMSKGLYCTQCEAEGFRKITFYPDRPDVMARFHVRVEGDFPVLLSNGNPIASGRGWAEWDDPWPKPAYLFALIAGDLVAHSQKFTTASGREVALNIWVRKGDEARCAYAMESLVRAMRWDEQIYGREYDLEVFNIVAVDDFNMGAMENKGLNIFNSRYVLASPESATDEDYARIEAIIAHEYFHNWTGNRITCRDWFQLCLKEGLTVFRDQQFSGDMRSHAVKRIDDVLTLRGRQFREDNGPLAHAVRPEQFVEINNFYTATIYEKGAEVIGMLKRLVGDAAYARALDLYFDRHDGQAATIEDWLKVFEDVTGRDLEQFKRWYSEAGTPRLSVIEDWYPETATFTLTLEQDNPKTPGQPIKGPKVIPVAVGLLNPNGHEVMPTTVLELTEPRQSFAFRGTPDGWIQVSAADTATAVVAGNNATRPVASVLRGFSAPVVLDRQVTSAERAFLLAHDTDPFNKWEAGRTLAKDGLARMVTAGAEPPLGWLEAMAVVTFDAGLDPAFRALALRLPAEDDMAATLAAAGHVPDPYRIHAERNRLRDALSKKLGPQLLGLIDELAEQGPFSPVASAAGRRALRLAALAIVSRHDGGTAAQAVFDKANNMTEEIGALACLLDVGAGQAELARFKTRWAKDALVMDKARMLQVGLANPEMAVVEAGTLLGAVGFDWKNPNRFRSVFGALSGHHAGFHVASGLGYKTAADWLIRLDPVNPQTAARMSTAFETWRRYDADRQALMQGELHRILATPGLSRDLSEMAQRMIG